MNPKPFDWAILADLRKHYVRKPVNPSQLAPKRIEATPVGTHAHGTFKEWTSWLKAQYLSR